MTKTAFALGALVLAWSAPAFAVPFGGVDQPQSAQHPPDQSVAAKARADLADSSALAQKNPFEAARVAALVKGAMAEPGFSSLTAAERHGAYLLLGFAELQSDDAAGALANLTIASKMPDGGAEDWSLRMYAAERMQDNIATVDSLAMLARHWPDKLAEHEDRSILQYAGMDDVAGATVRQSELIEALHAAHWHPASAFWDAGYLWLKLMRVRLDAGDVKGATALVDEISDPGAFIEFHADKRFDVLTSADPAKYDVPAAIARDLAAARARAAAAPDKLEGINRLAQTLLYANQIPEALSLLDGAFARMAGGKTVFSDQADQINWTMDGRARVLFYLGRRDDALAQRLLAAKEKEEGGVNVSQTINLAVLYNQLDRPRDALAAVDTLGPMSANGHMVLESMRVCAYSELNDDAGTAKSMVYLKAHAAGEEQIVLDADLCAGDMGDAAKIVIGQLANPVTRADMLHELQDYIVAPMTPHDAKMKARLDSIRARPEVKTAIDTVGRIGSWPLLEDQ